MRAWLAAWLALLLAAWAKPAVAHFVDDCEQEADRGLTIVGCTMVIESGRWSGVDLAAAYYNRGNAYSDLGHRKRAIQDYDEAIRIEPGYGSAYFNRGRLYGDLGHRKRAIRDYSRAISLEPGLAVAYYNRGNAYLYLDQFQRAIQDYDEAIRLDPGNADAHHNRGMVYRQLGQFQLAIRDYDQALRLDPRHATARDNRAIAQNSLAWELYTGGRAREGLAHVEAALADRPHDIYIIDTRAHIYAALGRTEEAVAEFEWAMRIGGVDVVREYQQALAGQGYDTGPIDGIYSAATRAALIACIQAGCQLFR